MVKRFLQHSWDAKLHQITFVFLCLFAAFLTFTIAGSQITYSLSVLLFLILLGKRKITLDFPMRFKLPLILLVGIGLLATIFSLAPLESLHNLRKFLLLPIVVLIPAIIQTRRQLLTLFAVFLGFALLLALFGIGKYLVTNWDKVISTQSTTMTWGAMSVFFVVGWAAIFAVIHDRRWRSAAFVALILQAVALFLSFVRGAYLGAFLGILVIGFLKMRKLLLYAFILVALIAVLFPHTVLQRIASIPDTKVGSTQVRLNQWRESVGIFQDYPILGVGWIDMHDVHVRHALPGADLNDQRFHIGHFHNNFIMMLMIAGIPGLLVFVWLFFAILRQQWQIYRLSKDDPWLQTIALLSLAGTSGFLCNGIFDWTFGDEEVVMILWFVIGLALAVQKLHRTPSSVASEKN